MERLSIEQLVVDGVRLNIGCGNIGLPGYVGVDIYPFFAADIVMDVSKDLHLLPSGKAQEIRLDAVFEHFYQYDQEEILKNFYRILRKDGRLVISLLPDFDVIVDAYLKKDRGIFGDIFNLFNVYRYTHGYPCPENSPHQLHKDIFTKDSIRMRLESSGFTIESLTNIAFEEELIPLNINIVAVKCGKTP